jgi:hypothetical protein
VSSAVNKRNPRAVARVLHDLLFRSSERSRKHKETLGDQPLPIPQKNLRNAQDVVKGVGSEQDYEEPFEVSALSGKHAWAELFSEVSNTGES